MISTDIIITNATILTMNDDDTILNNGFLCIKDDTIFSLGVGEDVNLYEAPKTIDARGGLVLPGLINGHTHAAMSLFRGIADDLPLMEWLNNYIFPVEKRLYPDLVHAGSLLACSEMIMSGITTFCDMYIFEDETAKAAKKACMRCLVGEVLYDFPSPNYGKIEKGFEYTKYLIEKWKDDPLVSIALEPHSLYTCSPDLLVKAGEMARKYNIPLITHVAETENEIVEVKKNRGMKPFEYLNFLGLLENHLIADHCVHIDEDELELMTLHEVKAIFNPQSNMKLASGIAPVPDMISSGVTVGLGTDGCASNNKLDLFSEMNMAAKLLKAHTLDPTVMDALTVLKMATIKGAEALGLDDKIGSLEKGKKADIIIMDMSKPHLTPMYNPYSHIVYAALASDVSHSIINGQLVMEQGKILTLDIEEVMDRVIDLSKDIQNWIA